MRTRLLPGILVCTIALFRCGTLASAHLESLLEPALNKDIISLQSNLVNYKRIKSEWPPEAQSLRVFSDSIGIPISNKFQELGIARNADSVSVRYNLRYLISDSSKYEFLKGDFSMAFSSDSTIAILHKSFEGKTKNGASVSSDKMDPLKLKQTKSK